MKPLDRAPDESAAVSRKLVRLAGCEPRDVEILFADN
jgi:hypothetical protein